MALGVAVALAQIGEFELNMDTVRALRSEGIAAVYGDARHLDTLTSAGVATARGLIAAPHLSRSTANAHESTRS